MLISSEMLKENMWPRLDKPTEKMSGTQLRSLPKLNLDGKRDQHLTEPKSYST